MEQIRWIEVAPQAGRTLMPASQRVIDAWSAHGVTVDGAVVVCDQFRTTQEIAQCPAIVAEAMTLLRG